MLRIFNQYLSSRSLFLMIFENLLILGTIELALQFQSQELQAGFGRDPWLFLRAALITMICQISLYYNDFYDLRVVKDRHELTVRVLHALGVSAILVAAVYLVFPGMFLGRGVFVLAVLFLAGFLVVSRLGFFWLDQLRQFKQPLLIVGTGELAKKLTAEILGRPGLGIEIVGFVSEDPSLIGKSIVNPTVLGHIREVSTVVERERVRHVVVAMPESRGKMPVKDLLALKMRGVTIEEATSLYEKVTGKIAVENLRPSWLIFSAGFEKSRLTLLYKRVFGILLSVTGLILLAPVMFIIAVLIKLNSRGTVLFRQERVGENGGTFTLLKFRSMFQDAESSTGPTWAAENDSRVTRVGRFIRQYRLDELPQFVNVLRGDMSFVGPRPERPHFVAQLSKQIPYYNQRHTVKPGITGWAQIKYRYSASVDDTLEKLQYDLFYIKNMSTSLDLLIIFQTIKLVLLGRGSC